MADSIPDDFIRMTVARHATVDGAWLDRLPGILDASACRWDLTLDPPMMPLSYNYVVPARCADGTSAILKVCVPGGEFALQVEALRLFDGHGAVRVVAAGEELCVDGIVRSFGQAFRVRDEILPKRRTLPSSPAQRRECIRPARPGKGRCAPHARHANIVAHDDGSSRGAWETGEENTWVGGGGCRD